MRRLVASFLVAVLLAACGGTSEGDRREASSDRGGGTRVPPPPLKPEAERDVLADLAEDAASQTAAPQPHVPSFRRPVLGADISWPQCPRGLGIPERRTLGLPMPLPEAEYVVIGLTNGPAFTPNPCLAEQVDWVRERGLMAAAYAVSSYPDRATLAEHGTSGPFQGDRQRGALANVGYQQARYNIDSMRAAGLETPVVWVDVEPVADFEWSGDRAANAAVVQGVVRGYADAGYRVGVYSTPLLWEQVVGDLSFGVPEWRAAGETSRAEAVSRCGRDWSIQGGPAVMGQWIRTEDQVGGQLGRGPVVGPWPFGPLTAGQPLPGIKGASSMS